MVLNRLAGTLFALETGALLILALVPYQTPVPHPAGLRQGDLDHFLAYAAYGGLFALWRARLPAGRRILFGLLAGATTGGIAEILQGLVPYRSADALDWLADMAGAGAGALVVAASRKLER